MQLTGEQLVWVIVAPMALQTGVTVAALFVLKRDVLQLFRSDTGDLLLRVLTLAIVACWVGALALANRFPESAVAAIFGSILGYVFGVGARTPRPPAGREPEPEPPPAPGGPDKP